MALTADEQALLDELTAKASQPDADDTFEVEIFSGDRGARLPYNRASKWLSDNFGIGDLTAAAAAGDGAQADGGQGDGQQQRQPGRPAKQAKAPGAPTPIAGYFQKRASGNG
jgi:hypothetical protein